jgi:Fic family protein
LILIDLTGGNEADPIYQQMEIANGNRQYDFLISIVNASLAVQQPYLSEHILKALNFQAITCLHTNAGEYRPCPVKVGDYNPPEHFRVDALMEAFVNQVNRFWESNDAVYLAAYVLWRLNYIHPFINGNGRTARAAAYFVLCVRSGGLLPGKQILPELIRANRDEYVLALKAADNSLKTPQLDLGVLHALLVRLVNEQLQSADVQAAQAAPAEPAAAAHVAQDANPSPAAEAPAAPEQTPPV